MWTSISVSNLICNLNFHCISFKLFRMIYLLLITIIANIITIMLVNFFRIHLDRTLNIYLSYWIFVEYPLDRTCTFNGAGQTYPRAFEACKMKKVFVDFKSKSNYSSLASMTFFHQFVLKANWAHVSMVWSTNGMKMILYLVFELFFIYSIINFYIIFSFMTWISCCNRFISAK